MTMHRRYIHDTQRYKTSECTEYNGRNTFEIHERYIKTRTIHQKYMVWGGIGPILGGKVALTPLSASFAPASSQARLTSVKWVSLL